MTQSVCLIYTHTHTHIAIPLTGPSTLPFFSDHTFAGWNRLHPPLRRHGASRDEPKDKLVIVAEGAAVIRALAVSLPGFARVEPLARVIDGEAEIVQWRWPLESRRTLCIDDQATGVTNWCVAHMSTITL